jgi:hypothetical protein
MHSRAQFPLQVLLLTAALCLGVTHTGHAVENQAFSGSLNATFSSPVKDGTLPGSGCTGFCIDNTITAVSTPTPVINSFAWGNNPDSSSLVFMPTAFTGQGPNVDFTIGTLKYHNGTSALTSLVFGVHFHLAFDGTILCAGIACNVIPTVNPYDADLIISTTVNAGVTNLADSDSVSFKVAFCTVAVGPKPPFCSDVSMLLHVFENDTATATLKGMFFSEPDLLLTGITLPPDDPHGFVVTVPEPGSLTLLGLGLGGIALTRRFRPVKR